MKEIIVAALVLAYNLALIVGTVVMIQFYDWSPWWFLLTILLGLSCKTKDDK
jgi:hypothetical protein